MNVQFDWGEANPEVGQLIEKELPNVPAEVKKAIADYCMDSVPAARMFTSSCEAVDTADDIRKIVGYPLSEHSHKRINEVIDRMKTV